jgi:hypothetical protein
VIHLRIVAPHHRAEDALDLLNASAAVCNVVYFPRAARRPEGDSSCATSPGARRA